MDTAISEHAEVERILKVKEDYVKVDEIPFDFERRRMSVILKQKNGKHLLICNDVRPRHEAEHYADETWLGENQLGGEATGDGHD